VNKTVASVIDDINEWPNPRGGSVFYVTAICTDESVLSVGRKDHDAALEVQGLLREAIGVEQDFTLEPKGITQTGRDKFKVLGFGTPGGAATYTAPSVQGGGTPTAAVERGRSRSPEQDVSIRASVAIKAAVELGGDINTVFENADAINAWLLEKTSDASSAYPSTDSPSVTPAGASEPTSPVPESTGPASEPSAPTGDLSGGGVESKGKEPAPPPHIHDWQPHPNLRNKLKCECGEMRSKESVK
jgi:hypothetical protein